MISTRGKALLLHVAAAMSDVLLSDVHLGIAAAAAAADAQAEHVSRYKYCDPSKQEHEVATIVHCLATPLQLVGQQVWSASFLLGDFILSNPERLQNCTVLKCITKISCTF
jgi:hypothetical protein